MSPSRHLPQAIRSGGGSAWNDDGDDDDDDNGDKEVASQWAHNELLKYIENKAVTDVHTKRARLAEVQSVSEVVKPYVLVLEGLPCHPQVWLALVQGNWPGGTKCGAARTQ